MIKEKYKYFCGHLWDTGMQQVNQDSLAFWQMKKGKENRIFAIVCDGIGGLSEGENASGYVVRQMVSWFMTSGYKIAKKKWKKLLQQLLFQIHEELKEYGKAQGIKLGTTVTFFLADDQEFLWGHYGDSRLYRIRRGRIYLLTKDDCEKGGMVNRAIGAGEWHLPAMGKGRFRCKDRFLMCTDGFYRGLDIEELKLWGKREVEEDEQAERMLRQMGQKKLSGGEKDNISALYWGKVKRERVRGREDRN